MKFLLAPVGTRGDVQPMVALAQGLVRRGHDVVVCCAENFQGLVEKSGARFKKGARDAQTMVQEHGESLNNLFTMTPVLRDLILEQFTLIEAAAAGDADV